MNEVLTGPYRAALYGEPLVEEYLGLTGIDMKRAPFLKEHIASRRNVVRMRALKWGMPLERIAYKLNVPLSVVEADIDYLAERGLI
ncbi:hypothetical protein [Streptomyces sp. NBC_00158]|uniref:hypothetical protein n=1 Tax=Streptomyces sp. NBC_00158 TaxID=2903627 RepID=UPI00324F16AB